MKKSLLSPVEGAYVSFEAFYGNRTVESHRWLLRDISHLSITEYQLRRVNCEH